jgi:hypothetical protein
MKKSMKKLSLKPETLKQLSADAVKLAVGGSPARTRELPCIEMTAKVDCH